MIPWLCLNKIKVFFVGPVNLLTNYLIYVLTHPGSSRSTILSLKFQFESKIWRI